MSAKGRNPYDWLDSEYNQSFVGNTGFTQLICESPAYVPAKKYFDSIERLRIIHDFQDRCIRLFREALQCGESEILDWLINETPVSFGLEYHKSLRDFHFTKPVFFRTDEMGIGKIAEIQCPGSSWGELELLYNYFLSTGVHFKWDSPADIFAQQLYEYLGKEPIIHYLTDNASIPAGVRYFIQQTRPKIRYGGIDQFIKASDCNFLRTHSFFGLCGENHFRERLRKEPAELMYDFPPNVLFDQKATLVLPFWSKTRHFFSDEIRDIIIYSTPIVGEKICLSNGDEMSITDFSNLPQSQRKYYVKYAGSDVSLNWGSKAVERLSNLGHRQCREKLERCASESVNGRIWLLQEEVSEKNTISYTQRNGELYCDNMNAKFSFFYGPFSLIGAVSTFSKKHKVHGQADSAVSLILPDGES